MEEMWKDVVGYEGLYQVGSFGNIRALNYNHTKVCKLIKLISTRRYAKVSLYKNGTTQHSVHRIVALAFLPNPERKPQVNHKDGNKLNNNASNLEWATSHENMRHARVNNLIKSATEFSLPQTKLSNNQVLEIREKIKHGARTTQLSIEYNVSAPTISDIKHCRTRKSI